MINGSSDLFNQELTQAMSFQSTFSCRQYWNKKNGILSWILHFGHSGLRHINWAYRGGSAALSSLRRIQHVCAKSRPNTVCKASEISLSASLFYSLTFFLRKVILWIFFDPKDKIFFFFFLNEAQHFSRCSFWRTHQRNALITWHHPLCSITKTKELQFWRLFKFTQMQLWCLQCHAIIFDHDEWYIITVYKVNHSLVGT